MIKSNWKYCSTYIGEKDTVVFENKILKVWMTASIVPPDTKSDRTDCYKYRGISLLSVSIQYMKGFWKTDKERSRRSLTQTVFRSGRSTQD